MAFNIFTLFAKLGIDTKEYDEGLTKAEDSGKSFGSSLSSGFRTALGIGAAAVGAVTTATVAGTKAFIDGAASVASYGDNVDKASQRLGLSTAAFQEWDYVLNIAGTSMDNMQMGMKTLTNQIDNARNGSSDAAARFEALGISMEELNTLSREEIFERAISGFQGMAESTERAALANDLFGRSGQELTPLFNMTAEDTAALIEQANEYGLVMSEDAVAASAKFQDSLTTMQGTMTGLRNRMLGEFLPGMSTVMDGLSMIFSGDTDSGLALIEEGVTGMTDRLAEMAPEMITIGGTIITALISSLSSNAPALLESGAEVINEIGLGLIENLPVILPAIFGLLETVGGSILDNADVLLGAGIDILMFLVNGIADNSEEIVPAIVTLAHTIISTLTTPEVLIPLLRGGFDIISGLIQGFAEASPELAAMIPELIANLIVSLENVAPDLGNTVLDLLGSLGLAILGIVGGLMGMTFDDIEQAWANITSLFDGGGDDLLDIVGDFGADILDSIFGTFDDMTSAASDAISDLLSIFDFDWSLPQIKLPHFSVTGGEAPWGFAGQGSFPSVSVKWYKKAMNAPMLLDSATIFGYARGQALGGGEAGDEMIYGRENLMRDISDVIDTKLSKMQFVVPVYVGTKKIQQEILTANAQANVISGGH